MDEDGHAAAPAASARPIVGSISEFSSSQENWENHVRRLNSWMKVNKIEDGEKVDVLGVNRCCQANGREDGKGHCSE